MSDIPDDKVVDEPKAEDWQAKYAELEKTSKERAEKLEGAVASLLQEREAKGKENEERKETKEEQASEGKLSIVDEIVRGMYDGTNREQPDGPTVYRNMASRIVNHIEARLGKMDEESAKRAAQTDANEWVKQKKAERDDVVARLSKTGYKFEDYADAVKEKLIANQSLTVEEALAVVAPEVVAAMKGKIPAETKTRGSEKEPTFNDFFKPGSSTSAGKKGSSGKASLNDRQTLQRLHDEVFGGG
jgi:hypothetical protein